MRFSLRAVGYRHFMSLRIAWRQMIQPTTTSQPIVLEDSNILRDIECCVLFVRYKTLNRLSENIEYSTVPLALSLTTIDLLSVCRSVTGRVALEIGSDLWIRGRRRKIPNKTKNRKYGNPNRVGTRVYTAAKQELVAKQFLLYLWTRISHIISTIFLEIDFSFFIIFYFNRIRVKFCWASIFKCYF